MANEKEILQHTTIFAAGKYVSYFFAIITGFIVARYLGPAMFGVYSALMLIVNYSQYSHLGSLFTLTKKVPFYIGKKDNKKANEIRLTTLSLCMSIAIVAALFLIVSSFFINNITKDTKYSLIAVAFIVIFQQLFFFYQHSLRAEKAFKHMTGIIVIYSLTYCIFTAAVVMILKISVLKIFLAMLAAYLCVMFYLYAAKKFETSFKFSLKSMFNLAWESRFLLIMSIMSLGILSVDKIMIAGLMDKTSMGYYSFAALVAGIIAYIPQSISNIIFPYLAERYGERENESDIQGYLFIPTKIMSYLLPVFVAFLFIVATSAIYLFLPQYEASVLPMQILLFATYFVSLVGTSNNFLITKNKERKVISLLIFPLILSTILSASLIKLGFGITWVAVSTLIAYFMYSLFIVRESLKHYRQKPFSYMSKIVYLPVVYIFLITMIIMKLVPFSNNFISEVALVVLKLALLGVASIPLLFIVNKETGIISTFFEMMKPKRRN